MTQGLTSPRQADVPLVQGLGAEFGLVLVHELLGISRAKQFTHLDGPRLGFFALSAEPSAREPPGSWWERASGDFAE